MTDQTLIGAARAALQAGDSQEAVRLLMQVLRQDGRNGEAWYWLEQALDDPQKKQDCANRWQALGFTPPTAVVETPIVETPPPLASPASIGSLAHPQPTQAFQPQQPMNQEQPMDEAPTTPQHQSYVEPTMAMPNYSQPAYGGPTMAMPQPAPTQTAPPGQVAPFQVSSGPIPTKNNQHKKRRDLAIIVIGLGLLLIAVAILLWAIEQRGGISATDSNSAVASQHGGTSGINSMADVDTFEPPEPLTFEELNQRSRLAVSAFIDDGDSDIYTLRPDGSELEALTDDPLFENMPLWINNGAQIIFMKNETAGKGTDKVDQNYCDTAYTAFECGWDFYMMDADGSEQQRLTDFENDYNFSPALSPDGTRIVFERRLDTFFINLYTMDIDGKNVQAVTDEYSSATTPSWSPDGKWIVFTDKDDAGVYQLFMIRPDGTDRSQLTFGPSSVCNARWSPDNVTISYVAGCDFTSDETEGRLVLMDVPTKQTTVLEVEQELLVGEGFPHTWSPDGSHLVINVTSDEGYSDLAIIDRTGTTIQLLQHESAGYAYPHWSPLLDE